MKDCKVCKKCKENKALSQFYKDRTRKDGFQRVCKNCGDSWIKEYKQKQGYYHSATMRNRTKSKGYGKYARRKEWLLAYAKRHPERIAARSAVRSALKKGTLEKKSCEKCGTPTASAHHYKGYERENWLDVKWLCIPHHSEETYSNTYV